jgi:hypothetical protein
MNIAEMKAAHKELLKQAEQIVTEAVKENKITAMNTNNAERLKIEVYKNLSALFLRDLPRIMTQP